MGDLMVVVERRGRLRMLAASRTGESEEHLRAQLGALHDALVFGATLRTVEAPRQDLRKLVRANEGVFRTLLRFCNRAPLLLFDAVPVLPLELKHRNTMRKVLESARPHAHYACVFAGAEIAALVQPSRPNLQLRPRDLVLLGAQIHSNPQMRLAPAILPICLPSISSTGYLYAHVSYLGSITRGPSRVAPALSEAVAEIEEQVPQSSGAAHSDRREAPQTRGAADGTERGGGGGDASGNAADPTGHPRAPAYGTSQSSRRALTLATQIEADVRAPAEEVATGIQERREHRQEEMRTDAVALAAESAALAAGGAGGTVGAGDVSGNGDGRRGGDSSSLVGAHSAPTVRHRAAPSVPPQQRRTDGSFVAPPQLPLDGLATGEQEIQGAEGVTTSRSQGSRSTHSSPRDRDRVGGRDASHGGADQDVLRAIAGETAVGTDASHGGAGVSQNNGSSGTSNEAGAGAAADHGAGKIREEVTEADDARRRFRSAEQAFLSTIPGASSARRLRRMLEGVTRKANDRARSDRRLVRKRARGDGEPSMDPANPSPQGASHEGAQPPELPRPSLPAAWARTGLEEGTLRSGPRPSSDPLTTVAN